MAKPRTSTLSVTDQFCGAGGSSQGARRLGLEIQLAMNHWQLAIETHNTNFPNTKHDCADISAVDPRRYWPTDILITSPECFPAGTLVLTKERLKPIEDVEIGDLVLTHKNRWRRVNYTKRSFANTIVIKGRGHVGLETTVSHPIYVADSYIHWLDKDANKRERRLHTPRWINAGEVIKGDDFSFWASPHVFGSERLPVPPVGGVEFDAYFWWMVGRWLGDGNLRKRHEANRPPKSKKRPARPWPAACEVCGETAARNPRHPHLANFTCGPACANKRYRTKSQGSSFHICCSYDEADELIEELSCCESFTWRRRDLRTAVLYSANSNEMVDWFIANFGEKAHGKRLPSWALTMPERARRSLLDGYVSADGSFDGRKVQTSTVSKELAFGIRLLALSLGYEPTMGISKRKSGVIEGRKVNMRPLYSVSWLVDPKVRRAQRDELHSWGMIKKVLVGAESVPVFNLGVDEDESYVADGIVVHNCTNHSVGKGQKRKRGQLSLFGDNKIDPAAERSRATMWDVPRFCEQHNYRMVIVENVVDARDWILFDDWLRAMHTLGYDHEIVYFNSMFGHMRPLANPQHGRFAPQSRDRMYCVFWKRGNKAPDLDFRPLAWCPSCERDVEAIQSWKDTPTTRKFGGRWGRYKDQYIYVCPNCSVPRKVVEALPYYYAAANAIDWSIPTPRVGDRPNPLKEKTYNRIKKGIEMFAGEHLLIDLSRTHGHDRRSVPLLRASMPTQTTAQTGALLMLPFMIETLYQGDRLPRSVAEQMATQTARQSAGLVMPPFLSIQYTPGYNKTLDDALAAITTSDHHGLVVPPFMASVNYYADNLRPADEPMPTQTTGEKMGVVIPPFLLGYANGESPARGVDESLRTIHTENGQAVVMPPFMVQFHNNQHARGLDDPMSTISTSGSHHGLLIPAFLMSYYKSNAGHRSVDREMGTLTTNDRHALVQPGGEISVEDCGFRMLQPHEIGRGMAFDDDYIVVGTKREKVRQYGNAVTPPTMERLLERCAQTFN